MSTVLVTGSSGFVARHLIPALLARGHGVHGLDCRPPPTDINFDYVHFDGDIRSPGAVARAMKGTDAIIHLAAEHKDFGVSTADYETVNVEGMKILLEAADTSNINDCIFYSSVAVYGDVPAGSNEDSPLIPKSDYGRTKLEAEKLLVQWGGESAGRSALIIRPTVIYGEFNTANMYRLVDSIARKRYFQLGPGDNKKSILYVANAVAATLHLMDRSESGVSVFNFSDAPVWTSGQIADAIAKELRQTIPSLKIPVGAGLAITKPIDWLAKVSGIDFPITSARIEKYLTDTIHNSDRLLTTGFSPPYSQLDGIRNTVRWYSETAK